LQGEQVALVAMLNTLKDLQNGLKQMSTLDKLSAHWHNFLRIGTPYIVKKSKSSIQSLENKLLNFSYKFFKQMRLPLPQVLKEFEYREEQSKDREAVRKQKQREFVGNKRQKTPEEQRIQRQMNEEFIFTPEIYTGRVTLFRPMEQISFSTPDFGWNDLAPGGLEIHDVPGDNYTMFAEPQVKVFAEKLKACLAKN
jgi:thioesterase domain-containing protein